MTDYFLKTARENGFTINELLDTNYTVKELKQYKYKLHEFVEPNVALYDLIKAGFKKVNLLEFFDEEDYEYAITL